MPFAPKERKKGKKIKVGGAEDIDAKNERLEEIKQQYEARETAIEQEAYKEAVEKENLENKYERQKEADRKWADEQKRIQTRRDKQNKETDENTEKIKLQQANTVEDTIKKKLEQTNLISKTGLQNLQSKNTISKTILQDAQTVETNSKDTLNRASTRNTNSKTRLQNTQNSHAVQDNLRKNIKFTAEATVKTWDRLIWWPLLAFGRFLVKVGQFIRRAWPYLKQIVLALFHFLFNHRMSAFAPYFTLFLVICLILGLIGFIALSASTVSESESDSGEETEPDGPQRDDTPNGHMWVLPNGVRIPVIEGQLPPMPTTPTVKKTSWFSMPSLSLPSMPRFITDGFDRLVPTYKAAMIAQNLAPYTSPIHVPELKTNPREKIVGRCDNLKYMETSLNSGEGGMCTTTDIPKPISWVIDITKSDDYKNLPDQIKKRVGTDGSKNKVTIPWKSDGFVYSPDCEKATFADGTPANLYNDHGEFCKKKEVDKIKYKDAWRIKKQFSYYKGIDAFE